MVRGFENVYEFVSKWKPRKKFAMSYLQRQKIENFWEIVNAKTRNVFE